MLMTVFDTTMGFFTSQSQKQSGPQIDKKNKNLDLGISRSKKVYLIWTYWNVNHKRTRKMHRKDSANHIHAAPQSLYHDDT